MFALILVVVVTMSSPAPAAQQQSQDSAQAAFRSQCVMCHGNDGSGRTPTGTALQVPDLRSAAAQKLTNAQMADIIAKGKDGRMPPFGSKLDQEQIQALVKFIRKFAPASKPSAKK